MGWRRRIGGVWGLEGEGLVGDRGSRIATVYVGMDGCCVII